MGQGIENNYLEFFTIFRKKFDASLGTFSEFMAFHNFNTEVVQFYVDERNWDGCQKFYNKVMDELIEHPPSIRVDAFRQDLDNFIPDFQEGTKVAFQRAFDVVGQNQEIKALFYCFEHRNIDGQGRCTLRLCSEYDANSLGWVTKRVTKGHPRFRLPKMTVDEFDYMDMDKMRGDEIANVSAIFKRYLNNRIIIAICMLLNEIPNRKIPVGIVEAGEDPEARFVSFI